MVSRHLARLLGRSPDGLLVFEKIARPWPILAGCSTLDVYKTWRLHLIDALVCLHSLSIVHRDPRIDNFLFADEGRRLVVCDLGSHWGQRAALEIAFAGGLDAGWMFHSDMYDIRNCIRASSTPTPPSQIRLIDPSRLPCRPSSTLACAECPASVRPW
ncbi:hypothetical protein B0T18DRAFT_461954 [Schizothecium vesticola]|uniref:Protein kinase domain-containing protein n=1 Tax=Schizothecium vesticola TaxID=314040 RepID=A0AA40K8K7_9PEZI|nr:hypothetical protein B0T18DRAFT_461954 [Schizothecium vesticola]